MLSTVSSEGPWTYGVTGGNIFDVRSADGRCIAVAAPRYREGIDEHHAAANAAFIAMARTGVPELLAEIKRLQDYLWIATEFWVGLVGADKTYDSVFVQGCRGPWTIYRVNDDGIGTWLRGDTWDATNSGDATPWYKLGEAIARAREFTINPCAGCGQDAGGDALCVACMKARGIAQGELTP